MDMCGCCGKPLPPGPLESKEGPDEGDGLCSGCLARWSAFGRLTEAMRTHILAACLVHSSRDIARRLGCSATDGRFVADAIVRVRYTATPEVARTVDHAAIRRALLAAGAIKIHGPFATITHTVTEASETLTEETDMLTGWHEWAALQGIDGPQLERLDRKVREALEVCRG